ncbi:ankyrin, partial [Lophium mytilinum]
LETRKGSRTQGTCKWILENGSYTTWKNDPEPGILWVSGSPGRGKTMLAIHTTKVLHKQEEYVLYFFCDSSREVTGNMILRSLIYQMLELDTSLFEHIQKIYRIRKQELLSDSGFELLWSVFTRMVQRPRSAEYQTKTLAPVYCILDGLDECNEASLDSFLKNLTRLYPNEYDEASSPSSSDSSDPPPPTRLKVIVSSRETKPECIGSYLSRFRRIRLDRDCKNGIKEDVARYIEANVRRIANSKENRWPDELREFATDELIEKSEGRYLWCAFVLDELEHRKHIEVEKTISEFPRGLENAYARILLRIDPQHHELVSKILCWVLGTRRSLSLREIGMMTNVSPARGQSEEAAVVEQLSYCNHLVQASRRRVFICHQTVRDYLLGRTDWDSRPTAFHFAADEINSTIWKTCCNVVVSGLSVLRRYHEERPQDEKFSGDKSRFLFFSYAIKFWATHATTQSIGSASDNENGGTLHNEDGSVSEDEKRGFYLSAPSLPKMWEFRFDTSSKKNQERNYGRSLLSIAAIRGHYDVVKFLLDAGAFIDSLDHYKHTPLHAACYSGYERVAELLLERGVSLQPALSGVNAIHPAVCSGSQSLVRLLYSREPVLNVSDKRGNHPLHIAASRWDQPMIGLLLELGADLPARNDLGQTLLHSAMLGYGSPGGPQVIRVLDRPGSRELEGLLLGLSPNRVLPCLVEWLIDNGLDVNAMDDHGNNPLHYAAALARDDVVSVLLQRNADVDALNKNGESPLWKA